MKRPTTLPIHSVLLNVGLIVGTAVERDWTTISSRVESEGMSFLTISLPSLCDALDQGLAQGRITPTMFAGFKPARRGGKLPALLHGFFIRIFDADGVLLSTPCIDSVRAIRQVTRFMKKVELPCSSARVKRAFERYVDNDTWIKETDRSQRCYHTFDRVAGILWSGLESLSWLIRESPGRYGPGATAERLNKNERYNSLTWYERWEPYFPMSDFLVSRPDRVDILSNVNLLPECDELPVRVVQVPKTLKTPRTISVEPANMMLIQQSVCAFLYAVLESGTLGFSSIRFTDQSVNQELARLGSIDGSLATIDLSDASDLVSNQLVKRMLKWCPTVLDYIQAARSTHAKLPNGKVIELNKYASMGSALCFPIESMLFLTLTVCSIVEQMGRSPSPRLVRSVCQDIAIYGDDIIVPNEAALGVCDKLESFGLKVNRSKSFMSGLFRESCGGDFFRGHDVTPVYLRHLNDPSKRLSGTQLISSISLSNQFYMKGLWYAAQSVRDSLGARGIKPIPRMHEDVGVLSYRSVLFSTGLRWDKHRHAYRVRGLKPRVARDVDEIGNESGFIRFSLGRKAVQDYRKNLRVYLGQLRQASVAFREDPMWSSCNAGCSGQEVSSSLSDRLCRSVWAGDAPSFSLEGDEGYLDAFTSVRSHSLSTKNGWAPVLSTGLR